MSCGGLPLTFAASPTHAMCGAQVVCLVVDEAHKATGCHSYVIAVRELYKLSGGFRVLALSATPGSNSATMQEVVTNLGISRIEARDEHSIDVIGCLRQRTVDKMIVDTTAE